MDSKLYKVLKQLKKLGILTNNTRVVRRRRRKRRVGNSSQQYTNSNIRPTTVITTPTVQSEQAIVNLKASEMQLQNALQNKNLPDGSKIKVQQAIEDIKAQLEQTNRTVNVNYNYLGDKIRDAKYYTVDEPDDLPVEIVSDTDKEYHKFVPQTKNPMSPSMGIQGSSPQIQQTAKEWLYMNDIDTDNDEAAKFAKVHPEEFSIPKPPLTPVEENVVKPASPPKEDVVEPIVDQSEKKVSSSAKSKEKKKRLIAQYAELTNTKTKDVPKFWDMNQLQDEVNKKRIPILQKRYADLGGDNRSMLLKSYTDIKRLQEAVDELADKLNKKG